jgi:hypothetical protein
LLELGDDMVKLRVIPVAGLDAYKLLRRKVTNEARTWACSNRDKTRLRHSRQNSGYIDVGAAGGVLVADIHPGEDGAYSIVEKLIGRLVAWFPQEVSAINVQFAADQDTGRRPRKKKAAKKVSGASR